MKKFYSILCVFALLLMSTGSVFATDLSTDENGGLTDTTADTTITFAVAPNYVVYIPETISLTKDSGSYTATGKGTVAIEAGAILPSGGIQIVLSALDSEMSGNFTLPLKAYAGDTIDSEHEITPTKNPVILREIPTGAITEDITQAITFQASGLDTLFKAGYTQGTATFTVGPAPDQIP